MDLLGPDFSDSRDPIFSDCRDPMIIFYDSRDPILNSRDPNRVPKKAWKILLYVCCKLPNVFHLGVLQSVCIYACWYIIWSKCENMGYAEVIKGVVRRCGSCPLSIKASRSRGSVAPLVTSFRSWQKRFCALCSLCHSFLPNTQHAAVLRCLQRCWYPVHESQPHIFTILWNSDITPVPLSQGSPNFFVRGPHELIQNMSRAGRLT